MVIKVYHTEVEAMDEDSKARIFSVSLNEPDSYTIQLLATTSKGSLELLLDSIRVGIDILELDA